MVIKLYISGISGNKEVKKKQQRVQMILDSKQINYEAIDITEPGKEKDKEFMQQNGKVRESLGKHPLPPQIFNDDDFCGDYEDFDLANEVDELEKFLHIETNSKDLENDKQNVSKSLSEASVSQISEKSFNPYEYHTFKIKLDNVNGLEERIITNLVAENEQSEEITKNEVNGESEAVPTSEPENIAENESGEAPAPEKEEAPSADDEGAQEKNEDTAEDNNQEEVEGEVEEEKKEEGEEVENPTDATEKEDKNEEDSPHLEGDEENAEESNEKVESEKEEEKEEEEKESEDESPQSEKSEAD